MFRPESIVGRCPHLGRKATAYMSDLPVMECDGPGGETQHARSSSLKTQAPLSAPLLKIDANR